MFILLVGYCFLRAIFREHHAQASKGPVIGAIIAILALVDVPLIHFSVKLWRGVHPSVLKEENGLPESYANALELMILWMLVLMVLLITLFFRYIKLSERVEELMHRSIQKLGGSNG